jgi:uncharacterized cupredoxin-like copper-binding protein
MKPIRTVATILAGAGLTLAACGGGSSDSTASAGDPDVQTVTIKSLDTLLFDPPTVTVRAGKVKFVHENTGAIIHSLVIEGEFRIANNGDSTITLAPGEYEYYCDVPGHREAGMHGTLTVTA